MRWLRHLLARPAHSYFPEPSLQRIAATIAQGERSHTGQVMFAVEADLPLSALWRGTSARERAEQAFATLRTWDTEANNGVLLYLELVDHAIEIVADRGLDPVPAAQWRQVCERMRERLRDGHELEAAVIDALEGISALVAARFPRQPGHAPDNELPDRPHLLG